MANQLLRMLFRGRDFQYLHMDLRIGLTKCKKCLGQQHRNCLVNAAHSDVALTCRVVLKNSRAPSSCSNAETRSDNADWLNPKRSPALRKCSSSATATKHSSCLMSNRLPFFHLFVDANPHAVVQSGLESADRACIFQRVQRIIASPVSARFEWHRPCRMVPNCHRL
ncbi:hypothetical protein GQR58_000031 [Nymphon striatum]|nr:hypothetical protein GQR58_000031 [Nymphon striatum]